MDDAFVPIDKEVICEHEAGGAIHAKSFQDGNQRWIIWKTDGNSLGGKSSCGGNSKEAEYKPTPIKIQRVADDGITLQGEPKIILDHNGDQDNGVIDSPLMWKISDTQYVRDPTITFPSSCMFAPVHSH